MYPEPVLFPPAAAELTLLLDFAVYGDPAPQGSKRGYAIARGKGAAREYTGQVAQVEMSAKVQPWRDAIRSASLTVAHQQGLPPGYARPVYVDMVFSVKRPKSRPKWWPKEWEWSAKLPARPMCTPDLDKMARSTGDGLAAAYRTVGTRGNKRRIPVPGLLADDKQIIEYRRLAKVFCNLGPDFDPDGLERPGARIRIWACPPPTPGVLYSVPVQSCR